MNESRSACRGTDSTHDLQVCPNFCLSQGRAKQKPSKDWSAHTWKHGVDRTGTCGEEGMDGAEDVESSKCSQFSGSNLERQQK